MPLTASADTNSNWIEVVYLVPSDSSHRGTAATRANYMVRAARQVQQQWASWGLTYQLKSEPRIVYSNKSIGELSGQGAWKRVVDDVKSHGIQTSDGHIKWNIFVDDVVDNASGAIATGWYAIYWDAVTKSIIEELDTNAAIRSAVGSIGHEQGHNFGVPHENCNGQAQGAAAELRARGLPDYGTKSLMCNGGHWPNVNPPEQWMRTEMFKSDRCPWFAECSGGDVSAGGTNSGNGGQAGGFSLRAGHSNKCIDASSNSAVVQRSCTNAGAQLFTERSNGNGVSLVTTSGRCLDVPNSDTNNGTGIATWSCNNGANQRFIRQGNSYRLAHSNRCLDVHQAGTQDGASVIQWDCSNGQNQQFTRLNTSGTSTANTGGTNSGNGGQAGGFSLRAGHSNKCIDASSNSAVVQRSCTNAGAQLFTERSNGNGVSLVTTSGRCLDVPNSDTNNGTGIATWSCNNGANQRFIRQGNSYRLAHSNRCLDVHQASTQDGASVIQWDCSNGQNQQFTRSR